MESGVFRSIGGSRKRYMLALVIVTATYVMGMPCLYFLLGVLKVGNPVILNLVAHVTAWAYVAVNGFLINSRLNAVASLAFPTRLGVAFGILPLAGLLLSGLGHGLGATRLAMLSIVVLGVHVATLSAGRGVKAVAPAQAAAAATTGPLTRTSTSTSVPTTDETPTAPVRRGWQLPGQGSTSNAASTPAQSSMRASIGPAAPDRLPTMPGAIFGQVRNKDQSTISSNQASEPIVTLRLERNDPHAGLNFVSILRMEGKDASGFADIGDWVEAIGRKKSAYLVASRCINHTTGGVYGDTGRQITKFARRILVCAFVMLWLGAAAAMFTRF